MIKPIPESSLMLWRLGDAIKPAVRDRRVHFILFIAAVASILICLVIGKRNGYYYPVYVSVDSDATVGTENGIRVCAFGPHGERQFLDGSGQGLFVLLPQPIVSLAIVSADSETLRRVSSVQVATRGDSNHWVQCQTQSAIPVANDSDPPLWHSKILLPENDAWQFRKIPKASSWNRAGAGTVIVTFFVALVLMCILLLAATGRDAGLSHDAARKPLPEGITIRDIALSFAVCTLTAIVFVPRFGGPDEFHQIVSVRGAGENCGSDHIVYSHIALGWALHTIYAIAPWIPVYSLHLFAALVVCGGCILHLIRVSSFRNAFLAAGIFVVCLPIWIYPQFTSIGGLLCFLGWLLAFNCARPTWKFVRTQCFVQSLLMLSWGGMIRFESFQHSLLIAGMMCLVPATLISALPYHRQVGIAFGRVLLLAAVPILLATTNGMIYKMSPKWHEWVQQNRAIASICDYRRIDSLKSLQFDRLLEQSNLSLNDYHLAGNWFYLGEAPYGDRSLEKLTDAVSVTSTFSLSQLALGFREFLTAGKSSKTVLIFTALMLVSYPISKVGYLQIAFMFAVTGAVHSMISMVLKAPPFRVFFPPFAAMAAFSSMLIVHSPRHHHIRDWLFFIRPTAMWAGAALLVLSLFSVGIESRRREVSWSLLRSEIQWMRNIEPAIFVQTASAMSFDFRFPFGETVFPRNIEIVLAGNLGCSPLVCDQIKNLGVDGHSVELLERPDLFLILMAGEDRNERIGYNEAFIKMLRIYLEERHGKTIESVSVAHCNSQWSFVSLKIKDSPSD
jgi:hypothetical protein